MGKFLVTGQSLIQGLAGGSLAGRWQPSVLREGINGITLVGIDPIAGILSFE